MVFTLLDVLESCWFLHRVVLPKLCCWFPWYMGLPDVGDLPWLMMVYEWWYKKLHYNYITCMESPALCRKASQTTWCLLVPSPKVNWGSCSSYFTKPKFLELKVTNSKRAWSKHGASLCWCLQIHSGTPAAARSLNGSLRSEALRLHSVIFLMCDQPTPSNFTSPSQVLSRHFDQETASTASFLLILLFSLSEA